MRHLGKILWDSVAPGYLAYSDISAMRVAICDFSFAPWPEIV